jgi:tRNA-dihydrouridine synthase
VDGVLIGRGAQGDPWLFRQKDRLKLALQSNRELVLDDTSISLAERFQVIVEHSEHFEVLCGRSRFMAMRKHLTWYCRNFRGAAEMRAQMTRANSAENVREQLLRYRASDRNLCADSSAITPDVPAGEMNLCSDEINSCL